MAMQFAKATKSQARLRLALQGPSGSGKTYSGLAVGSALAALAGSRLAVIDTERGSAAKYAGHDGFDFDTLELAEDQSPRAYREAIEAAERAGYRVILIDSLSHAWAGRGGALEQVDRAAGGSGNSFAAWRKVTPEHNRLVDAILASSAHIIVTMRSKIEYVLEDDSRGKKTPRKVGMAPVMRDGIEYEFDLVGEIGLDHTLTVTKSRSAELADKFFDRPGHAFAERVWAWLRDGSEPAPAQTAAPAAQPQEPAAPEEHQKRLAPETPADVLTEAVVRDVLKTWMGARSGTPQEVVDRFLRPHGARTVGECPFAWPQIVAAVEAEMKGGA